MIDDCSPTWAPKPKPSKSYEKTDYGMLLMNVENPEILNLKKHLVRSNLSEDMFIQMANNLIQMGSDQAHRRMTYREKDEVYSGLKESYSAFQLQDGINFMNEDSDKGIETKVNATTRGMYINE